MTTKDGIALWVLIIWVLATGAKPLFAFEEALRAGDSVATVAWDAFAVLVVAIAGIFLIRHYIVTLDDLRHYKGLEDARKREATERRADAVSDRNDKV